MCPYRTARFGGGRRRMVAACRSQGTAADERMHVDHPQWPLVTRSADEQSMFDPRSGRLSIHGNELGESASDWQLSKRRRPWPVHC